MFLIPKLLCKCQEREEASLIFERDLRPCATRPQEPISLCKNRRITQTDLKHIKIFGCKIDFNKNGETLDQLFTEIFIAAETLTDEISLNIEEFLVVPPEWNYSIDQTLRIEFFYRQSQSNCFVGSFDHYSFLTWEETELFLMNRSGNLSIPSKGDHREFLITDLEQVFSALLSFQRQQYSNHPLTI